MLGFIGPSTGAVRQAWVGCLGVLLLAAMPATRARAAAGSSAADFLAVDLGARSLGMASALSGLADDHQAYYHNPAGLAQLGRKVGGLDYVRAPLGVAYHRFVYAHTLGREWTFALGSDFMITDPVDKTDNAGNITGTYNTTGLVLGLSAARGLGHGFSAGATAKAVRETLDHYADATAAMDAGVLYRYRGIRLGASVKDFGGRLKLGTDSAPLPQTLKFGASYEPWDFLTFVAEARQARNEDLQAGLGTEARIPGTGICDFLSLRLGYKLRSAAQSVGPDLVGGFGFRIMEHYDVDVAFLPYPNMGTLAAVSLTARFGSDRFPLPVEKR